jgi:hypothetical protein
MFCAALRPAGHVEAGEEYDCSSRIEETVVKGEL